MHMRRHIIYMMHSSATHRSSSAPSSRPSSPVHSCLQDTGQVASASMVALEAKEMLAMTLHPISR